MAASKLYEVRVAGEVPPEILLDFGHLRATVQPAATMIHGPLPDQAALCVLLARLETYHVQLLEVRRCRRAAGVSVEAAKDA